MKRYSAFLVPVFFLSILTSPGEAATDLVAPPGISNSLSPVIHYVPDDYLTIQEAINSVPDGHTIIVRDGIYTGANNKNIDFSGKAVTLQSENGAESTIIDCENSGRGFHFHNGETNSSVVDGFTIQNGSADFGGGIYCDHSSPTISNCIIRDNSAQTGGGIFNEYSNQPHSLLINNCIISNNTATDRWRLELRCRGGGIANFGDITIVDSIISGNTSRSKVPANGVGGGIDNAGTASITNCIISNNSAVGTSSYTGAAGIGGGIHNTGTISISFSRLIGNTARADGGSRSPAPAFGGGIFTDSPGSTLISHCDISDNGAYASGPSYWGTGAPAYGGGVCAYTNTSIINCTISGNIVRGVDHDYVYPPEPCPGLGGGVYGGLDVAVINCTIYGNVSGEGGGFSGSGTITNCILWNNSPNQIDDAPTVTYSNVEGGYSGTGNIKSNPLFAGSGDFRLTSRSPCVDTGDNSIVDWEVDLDNRVRIWDGANNDPAIVDMGAYEYGAPSIYPYLILGGGDYSGDQTSDIAIFQPSIGLWSLRNISRFYFGASSDIPVPGDYNNDGTTDPGIFRPSSGLWAIRDITRVYFGSSSDIPVPIRFNPSSACNIGVFRENLGLWAVRDVTRVYFGRIGDVPVPGDYNGDSTGDIAIFRPASGLWAIRNVTRNYFGRSTDTAVPGDYDGTGTWDSGIFRPSSGLWAIRGVTRAYFGSSSDWPVPADYSGQGMDSIGILRPSSGLWAVREITRVYYGSSSVIPVTR